GIGARASAIREVPAATLVLRRGAQATEYCPLIQRSCGSVAIFLLVLRLADAFDGHDLFVLGHLEDAHALARARGEADAVDRHADELAAAGDQHDLVRVFHR